MVPVSQIVVGTDLAGAEHMRGVAANFGAAAGDPLHNALRILPRLRTA